MATVVIQDNSPSDVRRYAATTLGWHQSSFGMRSAIRPGLAASLLHSHYLLRIDPRFPFLDPRLTERTIAALAGNGEGLIQSGAPNPLLPSAIIPREILPKALWRLLRQRGRGGLLAAARELLKRAGRLRAAPPAPAFAWCLRTELIDEPLLESLGGSSTDEAALTAAGQLADSGMITQARERFVEAREGSATPNYWNRQLNRFERTLGLEELLSYPPDVAVNLTSVCNARCSFCNYGAVKARAEPFLGPDDIASLDWLRYVDKLGLGGGIGDPLALRGFPELFRRLVERHPHLHTRVITNGIALSSQLAELFAGRLDRLRVSLNAASAESWQRIMGVNGFDKVIEGLRALRAAKRRLRTAKPEVSLLIVVHRGSLEELVVFVELAHELGADEVHVSHFRPGIMAQCDLPLSESLYYDRERCDRWLKRARRRAGELGLRFDAPPLFAEAVGCYEACRSHRVPDPCGAPWSQCFLVVDGDGRRQLSHCCVDIDTRIGYGREELRGDGMIRLWNHPTLRHFRRTLATGQLSPVCRYCYRCDGENPDERAREQVDSEVSAAFDAMSTAFRNDSDPCIWAP
ncbi:radical SAM protein [Thioflavicoccus mobilis]|uniref:radical SAM protein n=1 Tax=Thioflavicoccus mobilis TaxID=80679 RepID=UPI0012FC2E52|nr:radical SAM protein [Thioflavicoccus mobilis]